MNRSLWEVRRRYPQAVAEYRLAMPRPVNHEFRQGYWAIVVRDHESAKTLGRGSTEAEAWEIAARAGRIESLLATLDQQASAIKAET